MHGSDGRAQDAEAEVAHQRTNRWGIEPVFSKLGWRSKAVAAPLWILSVCVPYLETEEEGGCFRTVRSMPPQP
jgi:hypothetical protein